MKYLKVLQLFDKLQSLLYIFLNCLLTRFFFLYTCVQHCVRAINKNNQNYIKHQTGMYKLKSKNVQNFQCAST